MIVVGSCYGCSTVQRSTPVVQFLQSYRVMLSAGALYTDCVIITFHGGVLLQCVPHVSTGMLSLQLDTVPDRQSLLHWQ
jgi:hypothetical protein